MRSKVIASFLELQSDAEIARKFSVSRQAIGAFRKRHEAELLAAASEVERQVTDFTIASKAQRIAELRWLEQRTRESSLWKGSTGN